jgi:hypothetical protein
MKPETFDALIYWVLAPVLIIYVALAFRRQRQQPLLSIPVYRLYVSPRRLLISFAILVAAAILAGLFFAR